jgi:hypothetical protein
MSNEVYQLKLMWGEGVEINGWMMKKRAVLLLWWAVQGLRCSSTDSTYSSIRHLLMSWVSEVNIPPGFSPVPQYRRLHLKSVWLRECANNSIAHAGDSERTSWLRECANESIARAGDSERTSRVREWQCQGQYEQVDHNQMCRFLRPASTSTT